MNKINKIKQAEIANIVTATIFFILALAAVIFFAVPSIMNATSSDSFIFTLVFYGIGTYACSILGAIWLISEIVNIILHITLFKTLESQEDIALRNNMLIWLVFTLIFLFGIANIVLAVKQNKILKMHKGC
ncbi:hypothetical protein ACM0IS_01540 [Mycoplasma aquilae ATCC BAA-1896]|uniref:hypothetical protein n=1 Tax=Mycoplasma aquilae TaxID=1312741 RepID=UPI003A86BF6B